MLVNNFIILLTPCNAQGLCYVSICLREMEVNFVEYNNAFSNNYVFTVLTKVCVKHTQTTMKNLVVYRGINSAKNLAPHVYSILVARA